MPILNFLISALIEFGPALAFFIFAITFDFFSGVKALIVSTIISLLLAQWRDNRIPIFMFANSMFVFTFSTAALYFNYTYLVVLEFTIYNLLFGIGAVYGYFINKPIMKILFGTMFSITDKGWKILSVRWGIAFFITAISSEIVWNLYGEQVWVYYRFLSILGLAIFGFLQFFLARRERLPEASPWGLKVYHKK